MDEHEIERFRQLLLEQRAQLLSVADSSDDAARPVELDQASVGRLSRMDAIQGQQMAQARVRRRAQQLAGIEGALRRIESGDYGYCYVCGEEIDPRRLRFDPTITRCTACKEV